MLVVDKPKYNMAIYEAKREVHVQMIGFAKEDIIDEYLKDLQETVAKVQKSSYTFVVDATYMSAMPSKASVGLGQAFMLYTTLGFKDVFIVNPSSKIAYVQIRNALETVDFTGTIVDDVSQLAIR